MLTKFFTPFSLFLIFTSIFAGCTATNKSEQAYTPKPRKHRTPTAKQTSFREILAEEIAKTLDPALGYVPTDRLEKAHRYAEELRTTQAQQKGNGSMGTNAAIANTTWQERGPNNVGGRVRAMLVDKNDATNKTVWTAGVGGGLWKTNDITLATPDWKVVDDFFSNIAITCIAQDPNTPNTMYFGTGEGWFNLDAIRGAGIWKTTDGGTTWAQLASTTSSTFQQVSKIVIDATGKVYAATQNGGLQRSSNGGTTWTKVIGSGVSSGPNNVAADVEIAADGDIYVSFGRIFSSGGVYKSDAATHGATTGDVGKWLNISPAGTYERVEIALAPSDANIIYVLTQNSAAEAGGIFYGTAAGGNIAPTWTNRGVPQMCDQGTLTEFTRGQAWYDLIAAVSPTDPNTLYIGGVDVLKTTDAGANFSQVTVWSSYTNGISAGSPAWANCGLSATPKPVMHADQHAITFIGGSASTMLFGNDGGVFYGTNMTATPTIISKSANLNITQYYACAVHPTTDNHTFLAGAQDNGTQRFSQTGLGTSTSVSGGDGAFCHIDQDNPLIQISAYTQNNYYVTTNGWSGNTNYTSNDGAFINPTDYDSANDLLYCSNGGLTGSYQRMTTAGVFTTVNVTAFGSGEITHVMVSPNTPTTVYFGFNNGNIVKVINANTVTGTVAGELIRTVNASRTVSCLAIETGNEAHMLATISNYGVTSVFETTTGTAAVPVWTSVEGNLPDMPIRWAMFAPDNNDHAFLATELGVWTTDNLNAGATVWGPSSNVSLANTRIDMLQTRTSDNLIAAASHGRGLFTTCKYCPYNKLSYTTTSSSFKETDLVTGTTCQKYRDITIPVSISKNPAANIVVNVTPTGTATAGSDFSLLTPTLTFTPNGKVQQNAVVRIFNDDEVENDETLILTIATASGEITETTLAVHTITLSSEDKAPLTFNTSLATVGAGTTNNNSTTPFRGGNEDERLQYIYTAAEMTAAGLTAGNIDALSLNVIKNSTGSYQNFTISIANTAQTNFSSIITTGFTQVYTSNYSTTSGTNTFDFATPFTWNGTSNIVIQLCFDNPNGVIAGASDFVTSHSITGKDAYIRTNTATGCSLTGTYFTNGARANTTFIKKLPATIQSAVNTATADEQYLGPNQTVHFYDNATGNILASIQNNSAHDFGCTKVEIDRAGTGVVPFWNNTPANYALAKSFKITPSTNNAAASHTTTLYYTQAEINGWISATGKTLADFQLAKIANASIADVTPAAPHTADITVAATTNRVAYKTTDHAFTATFTGFSGFGGGNFGASLPVAWLSFSGFYKNTNVVLEWKTATELNNKGFEVERSQDGIKFENIGFVNGNSTTNEAHAYTFEDTKPYQPRTYYRLRQIDFDGKTDFSPTINVNTKNDTKGLRFYPNPAQNSLTLQSDAPTTIKIIDAVGRTLQTILVETTEQTIDISSLPAGVYYLHDARGAVREFVKL